MTLADTLAPLAAELAQIASERADLDTREKDIKARIRDLVDGPDTYDAGDLTVTVSTNRRFNEKKALPLIPEEILPLVSYPETKIDREKLRALLPEVYESAQDHYDDKVVVR